MKGLMVFSSLITGMVFSVWMATSDATPTPLIASQSTLERSASASTAADTPKTKNDLDEQRLDEKYAEESESEFEHQS